MSHWRKEMKKAIVSVFAAVCVVGGGASALADDVSIPWSSSFEEPLTVGMSITNDPLSA